MKTESNVCCVVDSEIEEIHFVSLIYIHHISVGKYTTFTSNETTYLVLIRQHRKQHPPNEMTRTHD